MRPLILFPQLTAARGASVRVRGDAVSNDVWDSFYDQRNCPHVMVKAPFKADYSQLAELEATLQVSRSSTPSNLPHLVLP